MTATAIVAGIPIAIARSRNPSAPQSQSSSPDASSTAVVHPIPPAMSAVPHPRRMPSSRSDSAVATIADDEHHDDPEQRAEERDREQHHEPPVHGAPAPHNAEVVGAPDLGHEGAARLERQRAVGVGEERAGQRAVERRSRR